ncbi:MAG TPA: RagB/SusD family nutrient uptake outer membrane protein [Chitinophagaceae bacterium]|nr:RagB/SusD family nutrient uptake outer membrane protein [Chitinophagaceae bacterium]
MNHNIKIKVSVLLCSMIVVTGCTKLNEKLESTLTNQQTADALGASGTGLLLKAAYTDLTGPLNDVGQLVNLTGNSSDESLVPTRGGDWDDNGAWRVIHNHTWNADLGAILNTFNSLNKINFDATNVLAFNPTPVQAAEARFLRAWCLYYLVDLYGQYPIRNPGDNLLNAPEVKSGAAAVDFIISELNAILATLPDAAANMNYKANKDAARFLLMRCYLNKGAFANRATPTFADADMQQVITLGNSIMTSGRYSYTPNFFDNFSPDNNVKSREGIFAYENTGGVSTGNLDVRSFWYRTLHYNQYTPKNPNAGWNGFSTVAEFYNTFGIAGTPTQTPADTLLDQRIGGRFYRGSTDVSGIRPGLMIGQQYNENGVALRDRKNPSNPLIFDPLIGPGMIETVASREERTGIRVVKYPPDHVNFDGSAGNDVILFRYADAVLMVAEAMMRKATPDNAGALAMVNALRAARGAAPLPSMTLVNTTNHFDPLTLLAERGREMYWEYVRRTDLIRFGVFLKPWPYKPTSEAKHLLFPIPSQALAANPNLEQNPGY